MLRANIGVTKLARGGESATDDAFYARCDADFAALYRFAFAARRVLFELAAQLVDGHLELLKNRADDIAFGQCEKEMLGIDFATAAFNGALCSLLQELLCVLAQAFVGFAAASATATASDGNRAATTILALAFPAAAEEIVAEEIIKEGRTAA